MCRGPQVIISKNVFFVGDLLCVDPDEMSHLTAFYKCHILYGSPMCAKVPVMGFQVYRYMKSFGA